MSRRTKKLAVSIVATLVGAGAVTTQAGAAITPTTDAPSVANAIAANPGLISSATFDTIPGPAAAVADTPLAGFPLDGSSYGILSTGNPQLAANANTGGSDGESLGGGPVRGNTDRDVTILRIGLNVPEDKNCLGVDFRFASEEFPEFVGSQFNDAFIAELDSSTWTTSSSSISAPDNFALDPLGNVISINSTGPATVSPAEATGTTYDAATPLLRAQKQITPGAHVVFLSIFDQGDDIYDSAVFLDRAIAVRNVNPKHCTSQLVTPTNCFGKDATTVGTPGNDRLRGTRAADVIAGLGGRDKISGLKGKDRICGGPGKDKLSGGAAKDKLKGQGGKDALNGGGGKDTCKGGGSKDKGVACEKGKI